MAQGGNPWARKERREYTPADFEDSVTSLMWLVDYTVADTGMPRPPYLPSRPHRQNRIASFAAPCSPLAADPACMGVPHAPCKPISSSTSKAHHTAAVHPQLAEDIDYKTSQVKPPYSYATLIRMAMEASSEPKITLSAIYKWIADNFCYFRHAEPSWQNAIRHNLSLNKCFIKVPREKGEPGRGGFWKLDPQYANRLTRDKNRRPADGRAGQKRKLPSPEQPAKVSRLSSSASVTQEEQTELGSLKGDFNWEAILDTNLSNAINTEQLLDLDDITLPSAVLGVLASLL